MATPIPDNFKDLLNKKALADLATIMPDGSLQMPPGSTMMARTFA